MDKTATLTIGALSARVPLGISLAQGLTTYFSDACPGLALPCGGRGQCGKCRVRATGGLSPVTQEERAHLSTAQLALGDRLACRCFVTGDCTVMPIEEAAGQISIAGHMPAFAPEPLFTRYGIAVDLGTTTLAAQLYGPTGLLAEAGALNPQIRYGGDVITRMEQALRGPDQAALLGEAVCGGVAALGRELAQNAHIDPAQVDVLVIAGNTAMLYLLTRRNPAALTAAPFRADCLFDAWLSAGALGLPFPHARVYLPPCVSAFVGADTVAALLASGILTGPGPALLADVGTNGEIALWHGGRLLCCSTAAGPAFEGAGISMGMGGQVGAIDHVALGVGGQLIPHVIGGGAPNGICGSGIVDAVACLLENGRLEESGYLPGGAAVIGGTVPLTQQDIRAVQLAKSAICAGIVTLAARGGIPLEGIGDFALAGGFGSYLNWENGARIGLIPRQLAGVARTVGNGALAGAAMLLLQKGSIREGAAIAAAAETVELSADPVFAQAYVDCMAFSGEPPDQRER